MKKLTVIAFVMIFALSFVAGLLATPTEAREIPICPVYCDDGILYVCEPLLMGKGRVYKCICQPAGYCW